MKRAYTPLTPAERRVRAVDEVFFDLPDTPLRSELIAHLRSPGSRAGNPVPFADLSARAREWVSERGLAPKEA